MYKEMVHALAFSLNWVEILCFITFLLEMTVVKVVVLAWHWEIRWDVGHQKMEEEEKEQVWVWKCWKEGRHNTTNHRVIISLPFCRSAGHITDINRLNHHRLLVSLHFTKDIFESSFGFGENGRHDCWKMHMMIMWCDVYVVTNYASI